MGYAGAILAYTRAAPSPFSASTGLSLAVNDVVSDARMMRLLGKNGFEDLSALPLIGKGLVGLGSSNGQSQSVKKSPAS